MRWRRPTCECYSCAVPGHGDEPGWLSRSAPARDVRLVADPLAGWRPRRDKRSARSPRGARPVGPSRRSGARRGDAAAHDVDLPGERVPPEYAPMMSSEMGFVSNEPRGRAGSQARRAVNCRGSSSSAHGHQRYRPGRRAEPPRHRVHHPGEERRHRRHVVGERLPRRRRRHPNHAYSFSHGKRFHWSRFFALRDEIQDYLGAVHRRLRRPRHVLFGTTVESAAW